MKKKVYVGISGGVDSAVSALLLKEAGYEVIGVFLQLQNCASNKGEKTINKTAQSICDFLQIEYKKWNLYEKFSNSVIEEFIQKYQKGLTPNPCVTCNRKIKFGEFYQKAISEGADFIATGHYARSKYEGNEYKLLRGVDKNKDQSYFLYNLNQEILAHTIFPIGHLNKNTVRKIAFENNLPVANRKESQDICFIPSGNTNEFLQKYIRSNIGEILDIDTGKQIGTHQGLEKYTIGQRKGIKIGSDKAYFVIKKDINNNILFVGKGADHPLLFKSEIQTEKINWISDKQISFPFRCEIQTRYRQKSSEAKMLNSSIIKPDKPMRAISPGQSVVIYDDDECLGGGIIK